MSGLPFYSPPKTFLFVPARDAKSRLVYAFDSKLALRLAPSLLSTGTVHSDLTHNVNELSIPLLKILVRKEILENFLIHRKSTLPIVFPLPKPVIRTPGPILADQERADMAQRCPPL